MVEVSSKQTHDDCVVHIKIECPDLAMQEEIIDRISKTDDCESPGMIFINNVLEIAASSEVCDVVKNLEQKYN